MSKKSSRPKKGQEGAAAAVDMAEFASDCCPVCLEKLIYPCKLPCRHVFCYLCLKGSLTSATTTCPMCRAAVPDSFLTNPQLLLSPQDYQDLIEEKHKIKTKPSGEPSTSSTATATADDQPVPDASESKRYAWFYEGNHGYWMYDERTNAELEIAYQRDPHSNFQCLIAGKMYNIDFNLNLQYQVNDPARKRKIKRDLVTAEKKGVAGLRQSLIRETHHASSSSPAAEDEAAVEDASSIGKLLATFKRLDI